MQPTDLIADIETLLSEAKKRIEGAPNADPTQLRIAGERLRLFVEQLPPVDTEPESEPVPEREPKPEPDGPQRRSKRKS